MWKMGASNFSSFGSQLYGTLRRGAFCSGAQRPQGESTMLEKREERERKTKKIEEKHGCSLEPRYKCVKGKMELWKPSQERETDCLRGHRREAARGGRGSGAHRHITVRLARQTCPGTWADLTHRKEAVLRIPRIKRSGTVWLQRQFWVKAHSWMNSHFLLPQIWEQGNLGEPWPNPGVPEGTVRYRMQLQTLHFALERTHPTHLTPAASPHLSRI